MLTEEQKRRYRRQLILPEIGEEGQQKLGKARVLIVGLGGLGSISSYYLAAAGVGHLRIVDRDAVGLENLNRQLLHSTDDLGRPKVESASEKLLRLNPSCHVQTVIVNLGDENALGLAKGCSLIIDATDNLATRHVLNRVSLKKQIPFIYGGINGWNGMAATFIPGKTGCFACLFPPERPRASETAIPCAGSYGGRDRLHPEHGSPQDLIGSSSTAGGKLLTFRGLEMRFRITPIEQNPECPLCARPQEG